MTKLFLAVALGAGLSGCVIVADGDDWNDDADWRQTQDFNRAAIADLTLGTSINEIRDRLGSKLSTGNKQKVSIARTIVHDPPVMIFDEPTSGLDVLVARSVLETIDSLRDQGKCIVFSTHIMREVEKLCDRLAIVHRGEILAIGTIEELIDRYEQPDVEELFFELIRKHDEQVAATA